MKQRTAHDLVLVIPPPPLTKIAHNTRPCSKLKGTTFSEGGWVRGWVQCVTDTKMAAVLTIKAVFLCVLIFSQLVEAGSSWILLSCLYVLVNLNAKCYFNAECCLDAVYMLVGSWMLFVDAVCYLNAPCKFTDCNITFYSTPKLKTNQSSNPG